MQQVVVAHQTNGTSEIEDSINSRLKELGDGWRVVSANTTAEVADVWKEDAHLRDGILMAGHPKHVVYVTTAVIEKS